MFHGLVAPASAQVAPLRLEPLADIGCAACGGSEAFGLIRGVEVMSDGGLLVADRDPPLLRRFGPDGRAVNSFGRRGEGPGEFQFISGVAAFGDGGILVADMMSPRVTHLDATGAVRGTVRTTAPVMRLASAPGGGTAVVEEADWANMSTRVLVVDAGRGLEPNVLSPGGSAFTDPDGQPVSPGLLSTGVAADGRVAMAEGSTYRILIYAGTGEVVDSIVREVPRAPRTDEEMDALRRAFQSGARAAEAAASGSGSFPSAPEIDPLRPHFPPHALRWDDRGRLWVRTFRGTSGTTVFDLFGPEGAFMGEVTVDREVGSWTVGHGVLIAGVEDPEFDIRAVARWRIDEVASPNH